MEIHSNQEALDKLEQLKQDLANANKSGEPPKINGIEQAETIWNAYHHSKFYGSVKDIAEYLDVSKPKVSNCITIMRNMVPPLREWFRETPYQVHSLYRVATHSTAYQEEFLKQQRLLSVTTVSDVLKVMDMKYNSLSQKVTEE